MSGIKSMDPVRHDVKPLKKSDKDINKLAVMPGLSAPRSIMTEKHHDHQLFGQ